MKHTKSLLMIQYIIIICMMIWLHDKTHASTMPPIISRAQRWANEQLRLGPGPMPSKVIIKWSDESQITPSDKRAIADQYLVSNFPQDFRHDTIIRNRNGQSILRPIQVNNNKSKIIIHHTAADIASNASYDMIVQEVQRIYEFHTLSRRRWDMWYNYLIWPDGSIFEGRAWGPSAVWAHVVNNNSSSIGISLMGNFNNTKPTQAQLDSTIQLVAWLTNIYNINPYKQTTYHKNSNDHPYITSIAWDSLIWHKDAWDTSCPWTNLYNQLDYIKRQAIALNNQPSLRSSIPRISHTTKYYITSSHQPITIPRNKSTQISECTIDRPRFIQSCTLSQWSIIVHLSSTWPTRWNYELSRNTPQWKYRTSLSLESPWAVSPTRVAIQPTPSVSLNQVSGSRVNVLLYELTHNFNQRIVQCIGSCRVTLWSSWSAQVSSWTRFQLNHSRWVLSFRFNNQRYQIPHLSITALWTWSIQITNYSRTINNQALNTRRWTITRTPWSYKPINQATKTWIIVTNTIRRDDYMRWLILASSQQSQTYHDLMYLIGRNNMLYRSTNILTDDPRIHQYYAGAGAERLSLQWLTSHDRYNRSFISQSGEVNYIPHFECSNGQTTQWIWDIGVCQWWRASQWISRLGAQLLAQRWYTIQQIINYYLPWFATQSLLRRMP